MNSQLCYDCAGGLDLDWGPAHNENYRVLDKVAPAVFACPSNSMPRLLPQQKSGVQAAAADYAGIAGADGNDPQKRYFGHGHGNVHAYNGILCGNCEIRGSRITDGTSKVMLLAEQSDWAFTGANQPTDCRSSGLHGAWLGTFNKNFDRSAGNELDDRVYNTTTIGRPMGTRFCEFIRTNSGDTYCNGQPCTMLDNRTPVLSAHPGGAHVALADGSVQFLNEDIEFGIFQLMAIRDDGLTQPEQSGARR